MKIHRSYLTMFVFIFMLAGPCLFLGTMVFAIFRDLYQNSEISPKDYFCIPFGLAFYALAIYSIRMYFKITPNISYKENYLKIGRKNYLLSDIESARLSKKVPVKYPGFIYKVWGMQIVLYSEEVITIYDSQYSNLYELKQFLDKIINHNTPATQLDNEIITAEYELFKGNQFTSLRGILLWGITLCFLMILLSGHNIRFGHFLFLLLMTVFWVYLHSWMMHYFMIQGEYFEVRNHNIFWISLKYQLNSLKQIVYESEGNNPNSLRITTKDFRYKLYRAATLRDKHWLDMKDKLEALGITVRNRSI